MKRLLLTLSILFTFFFIGCTSSNSQKEKAKEAAITHVEDKYMIPSKYAYIVTELEHDQQYKGRGTVYFFKIEVNRGNTIHCWYVFVDILENGEIWNIDADRHD